MCARRQHITRYPPDLLWLDWFRGEKQEADALPKSHPIYVYHKNLLDHLGAHSSFSVRADRPAFPACFQSMADVWSLHAKERFQAVRPQQRPYWLPCGFGVATSGPWRMSTAACEIVL